MAQATVALWKRRPEVNLQEVPHPSSRDETKLLDEWRAAVTELRGIVTADSDGDNGGPNYGTKFSEAEYAPSPRRSKARGIAEGRRQHRTRREHDPPNRGAQTPQAGGASAWRSGDTVELRPPEPDPGPKDPHPPPVAPLPGDSGDDAEPRPPKPIRAR
jgi:hypothetical protein